MEGVKPELFILDNEIFGKVRAVIKTYEIKYQIVPPAQHCRNAVERAIQTFKNHFLSGLATLPPNFPMTEWDRLLKQATITLNLLLHARLNPKLSAHAFLHGVFEYNKCPLAPPGTQIVIYEKNTHRRSWDIHGKDAWYIGPAMEHYRCVPAYIPHTGKERICDTQPQKELLDAITTTARLLHRASIKPTISHPVRIPTLPPMAKFFKNPRTPLPSPIVHAPTIIPLDPESPSLLHVPFPRVTPVRTLRVQFSPIIEDILPLRFNLPSRANIYYTSSLRVPNAPPNVAPTRTFKPYTQLQSLVANEIFHHNMHHIYNADGNKELNDSLLNGKNKHIWERSLSNEFGCLLKGNKYGVTYASFVFDFRPLKNEQYRCRLVVGGDKLPYPNDASSPAASLLETKILLNSTISDAKNGARFMAADLKDFFLASPMDSPEFMKIPLKHIPEDIITTYNLRNLVTSDGYVYVKIKKGMYGLKQAAILSYNNLVKNLQEDEYFPIPHTVGLWKYAIRKTIFYLCFDHFGIQYFNKDDANNLLTSLQKHYTISTYWQGTNYCGLMIKWNYPAQYIDISMPGYIEKLLARLKYKLPPHPTTMPFKIPRPEYSKQTQMAKPPNTSTKLSSKDTIRVQTIVGSILYYVRAIEHSDLPALNELRHEQNKPKKKTMKK